MIILRNHHQHDNGIDSLEDTTLHVPVGFKARVYNVLKGGRDRIQARENRTCFTKKVIDGVKLLITTEGGQGDSQEHRDVRVPQVWMGCYA